MVQLVTVMVILPEAKPLPVGVAVTVADPVATKVAVAVVPEPLTVSTAVLPLDQVQAVLAVSVICCVVRLALVPPLHPVVQVTVTGVCPIVTGILPFIAPSDVVAVIVTALLVLATTAVIAPLSLVLLTVIWALSPELQFTEPVKTFVLLSS